MDASTDDHYGGRWSEQLSGILDRIEEWAPPSRVVVVQRDRIAEVRSAQHAVHIVPYIVRNGSRGPASQPHVLQLVELDDDTSQRMVVRIWKGSARWWNLNAGGSSLSGVVDIATAEVAGYRIARRVLREAASSVIVPKVLYFSHDEHCNNEHNPAAHPWALFQYIGQGSSCFLTPPQNNHHTGGKHLKPLGYYNDTLVKSMIKIRHEFGFLESHPRHGRVKDDVALPYALRLMDTIVLPLHCYIFDRLLLHASNDLQEVEISKNIELLISAHGGCMYQFHSMVQLYHETAVWLQQHFKPKIEVDGEHTCQASSINGLTPCSKSVCSSNDANNASTRDRTLSQMIQCLIEHIQYLQNNEMTCSIPALPMVLCHMDLQPQNLICYNKVQRRGGDAEVEKGEDTKMTIKEATSQTFANINIPHIASVLDWEECAWADPRFDLLLICRKVVANYDQANHIWNYYSRKINERYRSCCGTAMFKSTATANDSDANFVGPIHPWLLLESAHSICTILSQVIKDKKVMTVEGTVTIIEHTNDDNDNNRLCEIYISDELYNQLQREFHRLLRHRTSCEMMMEAKERKGRSRIK